MNKKEDDIIRRFELGIQLGVHKALDQHKRMGWPIVVWQGGAVVKIPPEEIVVPPKPDLSELGNFEDDM